MRGDKHTISHILAAIRRTAFTVVVLAASPLIQRVNIGPRFREVVVFHFKQ